MEEVPGRTTRQVRFRVAVILHRPPGPTWLAAGATAEGSDAGAGAGVASGFVPRYGLRQPCRALLRKSGRGAPPALLPMIASLWSHRYLIAQFTRRNLEARYRGSHLGMAWPFVTPLLMLVVYTLVFSVIFKARWGPDPTNHLQFAFMVFAGLIAFGVFSESVTSAPGLIVSNPNFVKKVRFPLEILPVSSVLAASTHSCFSLLVLLVAQGALEQRLPWSLLLLPVVYVPLVLLALGLSWFLASLGVFTRDVGQVVGVVVQMLFFLTPIFYPASAVPERLAPLLLANPLATIVTAFRQVVLIGVVPDWRAFGVVSIASAILAAAGYRWFVRSKSAFADVM